MTTAAPSRHSRRANISTVRQGHRKTGCGYDNADELNAVTDFAGTTVGITSTADGLPHVETLGSTGDTITTTYDPTDSPSQITLANSSTTLQQFGYSNFPSGSIAAETDTPSSSDEPADYTYDGQGRVTQMQPGSNSALNYGFDASGNLTTLPRTVGESSADLRFLTGRLSS